MPDILESEESMREFVEYLDRGDPLKDCYDEYDIAGALQCLIEEKLPEFNKPLHIANTVRVRIAVAIDPTGKWAVAGYSGFTDGDAQSCALESLDVSDAVLHWIEADVPIPETTTIQGEVVK